MGGGGIGKNEAQIGFLESREAKGLLSIPRVYSRVGKDRLWKDAFHEKLDKQRFLTSIAFRSEPSSHDGSFFAQSRQRSSGSWSC